MEGLPKPYYSDGKATIYHGDALEVMRVMDTGSLDALVCDPPYCAGSVSEAQRTRAAGQGLRSDTLRRFGWFVGDNMGTAGLAWLLRSMALETLRVVKPSGSLLVFCDWRMQATLQPAIESAGLRYQGLIVWDKEHMGLGAGFRNRHELILHFTLGAPEYHNKGTPNVLRCKRVGRGERKHQTQKPVDLMRQLIRVVAPSGGVVLDPFAGSMSTGLACKEEGRRFVGIERDPQYLKVGVDRLSQESLTLAVS
ncbi:MAG: site-specific DNA-methyltransferase [Actinomycetota bacterium]|nr:site-specific DNA-methyltransferase [Actinomycetota bacterium]